MAITRKTHEVDILDLKQYSMEDLLLAAVKAEVEARDIYKKVSGMVNNAFMRERMSFLASEEEKHREFIVKLYHERFPGKDVELPDKTPVPMPSMVVPGGDIPLSDVFQSAMKAEQDSHDFYNSLADMFDEKEIRSTLRYFASMEMAHYRILEDEKRVLENYEDFDTEWPMMHIGP